jgi:transposase
MGTATTTATTTAVTTATAGLMLALDLGKYQRVACRYTGSPATARFDSFTTDRARRAKLLQRCQPGVVVIEAGLLAGWVHDLCAQRGFPCLVANTAREAWKCQHLKRKTDRDDARRLAQLHALGQLPTVALPPPATRPWRRLIAYRQALVGRRVAVQNRSRARFVAQGLPAPRGAKAWTATGLDGLALQAQTLAGCGPDALWRGLLHLALTAYRQLRELLDAAEGRLDALAKSDRNVQLRETAPGVGPRTAEAIVAHLHQPERFARGKQVSAYVGLAPKQFPSGEADRRGRITRRGPALLRELLVECAWVMLRYNGWARAAYLRLTHGGKARKEQAIVALARKLLVRCWAMLRDQQPWRDQTPAPAATAGT